MNNDNARSPDVLRDLLVIDRLDVEVTRLETNRMSATYRVSANGETHETEFAYRYAENVFDPDDPAEDVQLVATDTVGIAGAIVILVVGLDDHLGQGAELVWHHVDADGRGDASARRGSEGARGEGAAGTACGA